ncbi:transcriptional regulator [Chitinophaga niastensis]|uniref:Transcriptional regulator n=1 Tax=Chitinophaga niastensis TaxID=536980 RepID=A0A2P8HJL0_CHINA|nr:metalloregulator ArsR/SmtB family transcription factor [Chitinophaga niastensis]PSL46401.1 transcriptional regulator [Chitinophaga niastensis]
MINNFADNERAVWILKTMGPQPLNIIAAEMKITTEGARFQLLKLANEGLVQATTESKGRGRPQQIWALTDAGNARFPDKHEELTLKLLHSMREALGADAVKCILDANEKSGINKYKEDLKGLTDLESRIKVLTDIRNKEGYMAEYIKEGNDFLLIENHCPIHAAAKCCTRFCQSELDTFIAVLGKNVSVTRTEHIMAGARRCAYKISQGE